MIRLGNSSSKAANDLWKMCRRDILFYVNTFVWTEDPRIEHGSTIIPFVTWDFQDDALLRLAGAAGFLDNVETHHVRIEKSRDMGATWLCMALSDWAWRFFDRMLVMIASRKEELVDKTDKPDCLFAKLDVINSMAPAFLRPPRRRQLLTIGNQQNGAIINGESTTGDIGRGGRSRFIVLDEFGSFESVKPGAGREALASAHANTHCLITNTTPKGTHTADYDLKSRGRDTITLWWPMHPLKRPGLYRSKNGVLEILDGQYDFDAEYRRLRRGVANDGQPHPRVQNEESYPFVLDGKVRSPWYDQTEYDAGSDKEMAQEHDLDYFGAGDPFFDETVLNRVLSEDCRLPLRRCRAVDIWPDCDVQEQAGMPLSLWMNLVNGKPPDDASYVAGCDISTGTGVSDSVLAVYDRDTREKVLEYVNNHVLPEDFAKLVVGLCTLFSTRKSKCYLGWEAGGPGDAFGVRVTRDLNYGHVYYRRDEGDFKAKRASKPGWRQNKTLKLQLMQDYRRDLGLGKIVNRSKASISQCFQYVYTQDGGVEHAKQRTKESTSGNKENHGDMVIADAIAAKVLSEYKAHVDSRHREPPYGSLAWRLAEHAKSDAAKTMW